MYKNMFCQELSEQLRVIGKRMSICTMPHIVIHQMPARQRLQPLSVAFIQLPTPTSFNFQHAITTPINRATLGMESPEVGDTAHAISRANQAFRKRPRARRVMPSMSLTPQPPG